MQTKTGRPHWLVVDEAHHVLPASGHSPGSFLAAEEMLSSILITVEPVRVDPKALFDVNLVIAVGAAPQETFRQFSDHIGLAPPKIQASETENSLVHLWQCKESGEAVPVRIEPGETDRRRHRRKYAEGDLQDKSFHFRGPEGKLNLRAQNLIMFIQLSEGIDDATWLYHLERHEYSEWVRTAIKDTTLADSIALIERAHLPPEESRRRIKTAIEEIYTHPS
jgi:hypothetical protein